jgi:hypothetical protein
VLPLMWTVVDSGPLHGLRFIDLLYTVIPFLGGDGFSSLGLGIL